MFCILAVCVGLLALVVYLIAPGRAERQRLAPFKGWNYAHRGLHSKDLSVPENSLAAFDAAATAGYGIELDVQLSADGQVVVFHDDTLDRVTGATGPVKGHTFAQLSGLKLHGTGETIPLFSQVLKTVAGRTPIIVELKSGKGSGELCQKTCQLLRQYTGVFCVESFDPTIVAWFRRHAPEFVRGQLANNYGDFKNAPPVLRFILSRCLGNCIARPHFIAWGPGPKNILVKLAERLGAMKIYWTAQPTQNTAALQADYDGVIFEFYTPEPRY